MATDYAFRFDNPFFNSLWVRAWGEQYPADVRPYSSCTKQLLSELRGCIRMNADGVLLDLGCGTGGVGLYLASQVGCRLIGVDRSNAGIEIAKRRMPDWPLTTSAAFYTAQFHATGLSAASIDSVISIDALPFSEDVDLALREIARLLKRDGRLIFTAREPRTNSRQAKKLGPAWSRALKENGFQSLRVMERKGVSDRWRAVYEQWRKNEARLRAELPPGVVDQLMEEVESIGPKLEDKRAWLLITAAATGG